MKNKILLLITVITTMLGITSVCWSSGDFNIRDYEGTTIKIGTGAGPHLDFIEEVAPEFEAMTGIKVIAEGNPYAQHHDKLILDLSSKTGNYDLLMVNNMWKGEFIDAGDFLEPIDRFINDPHFPDPQIEGIVPKLWEVYYGDYKGVTYGFPFLPDAMVFCLNKEMFAKAGLPGAPNTWEQVYEYGKKLTQDIDGDGKIDQYGFALMAGGEIQTMCTHSALLYAYGGRFFDEQLNPQFSSDAGIKAMKMFIKLLDIAPPGALEADIGEAINQMAQGLTAMMLQWPAAILVPLEDPAQSKVVGKIGYTLAPNRVTPFGGWGMCMSRFIPEKRKKASYLFMDWFFSPEMDLRKALGGMTPCRTASYQDKKALEKYPYLSVFGETLSFGVEWPPIPPIDEIFNYISLYCSKALIGELSAEDAMSKLDKEVERVLEFSGMK